MYPISSRSPTGSPAHSPSAAGQSEPQPAGANPAPQQAEVDGFASNRAQVGRIMNGQGSQGRRRQHPEGDTPAVPAKRIRLSANLDPQLVAAITTAEVRLQQICAQKHITINDSLIKAINTCPNEDKVRFINMVAHYFDNVGAAAIKNTTTLTSMLYFGESDLATKARIRQFLTLDQDNIARVAQSPCLTSVSSMYHGKGFPDAAALDAFMSMDCLKVNGQVDLAIVRSITSMRNGRGFPNATAVEELLSCEGLRRGSEVAQELLRCISSMAHGRDIPRKAAVDALLSVEELKIDGRVDADLLSRISAICHSRGLPRVDDLRQVLRAVNHYGGSPMPLMKYIAGLCSNLGMPAADNIVTLLSRPGLYTDGSLNLSILEQVARVHRGKGFPSDAMISSARTSLGLDAVETADAQSPPRDQEFYANLANFVYDDEQPTTSAAANLPATSGAQSGLQGSSRLPLTQPTPLASSGRQLLRGRRRTAAPTATISSAQQLPASGQPPSRDPQPYFTSFWPQSGNFADGSVDLVEQSQEAISTTNLQVLSMLDGSAATGSAQPSTSTANQGQAGSSETGPDMLGLIMECIEEEEAAAASAQREVMFDIAEAFISEQDASAASGSAQPSTSGAGAEQE